MKQGEGTCALSARGRSVWVDSFSFLLNLIKTTIPSVRPALGIRSLSLSRRHESLQEVTTPGINTNIEATEGGGTGFVRKRNMLMYGRT